MNETPRTDAEAFDYPPGIVVVTATFARTLETELAATQAKLEAAEQDCGTAWLSQHDWQERALAAESALARAEGDARRYKWLREKWGGNEFPQLLVTVAPDGTNTSRVSSKNEQIDAAIDAAMSSGGAG